MSPTNFKLLSHLTNHCSFLFQCFTFFCFSLLRQAWMSLSRLWFSSIAGIFFLTAVFVYVRSLIFAICGFNNLFSSTPLPNWQAFPSIEKNIFPISLDGKHQSCGLFLMSSCHSFWVANASILSQFLPSGSFNSVNTGV